MDIDVLLDLALHINLKKSESVNKEIYNPYSFAKEFQTVKVSVGRQTGHTTYIAKKMGTLDIAFTDSNISKKNLKNCQHFDREVISISQLNKFNILKNYDKVWIDNASFISNDDLHEIYKKFSGKANQFILLG